MKPTAKDSEAIFHLIWRSVTEMVRWFVVFALSVSVSSLEYFWQRNKSVSSDDVALYESLKDYILNEEKLIEYNYPVQHPEKSGCAALFVDNKKITGDRELMMFLCH